MARILKVAGIGFAVGLMMASVPVASAKQPSDAKHPGSGSVQPSAKLKGYIVVDSGALTANASVQTRGQALCPTGTKPLGGGVFVSSTSLSANVNSSYPSTKGWVGDVNNGSGASTAFHVYAVCAKKPGGYRVVSAKASNPASSQSGVVATCPTGSEVLGGGGYSSSGSLAVNLNTMWPIESDSWDVAMNNATGSAATVTSYAVCGKNVTGWGIVAGVAVKNPAGAETFASAPCPSGSDVLGGGVGSSGKSTDVNINSTYPNHMTWVADENNASAGDQFVGAYAICAKS